jgi:hypothetical protein
MARPPHQPRPRQSGKALTRRDGDSQTILFPDRQAQPLKTRVLKHQSRLRDGYGSHHNGRHKSG